MAIKGKKDGILYHVDQIQLENDRLTFRGFALSQSHEPVTYTIRNKERVLTEQEDYTIGVLEREDISQMLFSSDEWKNCGFEITVPRLQDRKLWVELQAGEQKETFSVAPGNVVSRLKQWRRDVRFQRANRSYHRFLEKFYLYGEHVKAQKQEKFAFEPKISVIVPVYQPDLTTFKLFVESVQRQTYENWELCIACGTKGNIALSQLLRKYKTEEARFDFRILDNNEGIAGNTNRGLEMATGDVLVFVDQDDLIVRDAFYQIVSAMNRYPDAEMVYTDEDKITMDGKTCFEPHFKTDYNPDMLYTNNYMCHLTAIKRSLLERVGNFNPEMDGAQDFDMYLRCTEAASRVVHIPKVLYHWRSHPGSTASSLGQKDYCADAGRKVVEEHLKRCHIQATVKPKEEGRNYYQIHYEYSPKEHPMLSVVFTGTDKAGKLDDLNKKADKLNKDSVEVLMYTPMTGISNTSKGEYILFLNARAEFEDTEWLNQLFGVLQRPDVAGAGGRLIRRDGRIYEMGMAFSGGEVFSIFRNAPSDSAGYANRNRIQQDLSILSLDFMLVKTRCFLEAGGLRKGAGTVMQSVSLCLNLRKLGYRLVTMPSAQLVIAEEAASESEEAGNKPAVSDINIESEEDKAIYEEWKAVLQGPDPYFSRWLKQTHEGNWVLNV